MLLLFTADKEAGRMVYTVVPAAAEGRDPRGEEKARPLLLPTAVGLQRAGEADANAGFL